MDLVFLRQFKIPCLRIVTYDLVIPFPDRPDQFRFHAFPVQHLHEISSVWCAQKDRARREQLIRIELEALADLHGFLPDGDRP